MCYKTIGVTRMLHRDVTTTLVCFSKYDRTIMIRPYRLFNGRGLANFLEIFFFFFFHRPLSKRARDIDKTFNVRTKRLFHTRVDRSLSRRSSLGENRCGRRHASSRIFRKIVRTGRYACVRDVYQINLTHSENIASLLAAVIVLQ